MYFRSFDGTVVVPINGSAAGSTRIVFRPQNSGPMNGTTRLDGIVDHKECLGSMIRYRVKNGQQFILVDASHQQGADALPEGAYVSVYLNQEQVIKLIE